MISSYVGENALFEKQLLSIELEVELTPKAHWPKNARWRRWHPSLLYRHWIRHTHREGKEVRIFNGRPIF